MTPSSSSEPAQPVRRFLLAATPFAAPSTATFTFTFAQFSSHLRRATENHPRPTTPKLESVEHSADFATPPLCVFSRSFSSHHRQGAVALFLFPLRAGATTLPHTVPHSLMVRRRDEQQSLDVPWFDRGRACVTACRTHRRVQTGGESWYQEHAFTYTTARGAAVDTHGNTRTVPQSAIKMTRSSSL